MERPSATLETPIRPREIASVPKVGQEAFNTPRNEAMKRMRSISALSNNNPETTVKLLALYDKQETQQNILLQRFANEQEHSKTERNNFLTEHAKVMLYEKLGIDADVAKNGGMKQFLKGLVDEVAIFAKNRSEELLGGSSVPQVLNFSRQKVNDTIAPDRKF